MALKARNFIADEYKMGATVEGISGVLQNGLAGTAMVAYPQFDAEERKAIANYILFLKDPSALAVPETPKKVEHVEAKPTPVVKATKVEATPAPVVVATKVETTSAPVAKATKANSENPLIATGRKLYKKGGCVSCHGENGQADTPTGMALKARNFVVGEYKMGASVDGISGVLQNGLAGTAMAAYPQYDAEQRKAIATFLLALKGHPEVADSPEPKVASGSGKTSIAFAMSALAENPRHQFSYDFQDGSAGADVYAQNCASCHGAQGQGGIATRMVSAAPYYRVKTLPLLGHDGDWMKEANFKKIVTEGTPGKLMPGMGTLTQQELSDLYSFFKAALEKAK
jgi:mono/diheme cytochrome c family protein